MPSASGAFGEGGVSEVRDCKGSSKHFPLQVSNPNQASDECSPNRLMHSEEAVLGVRMKLRAAVLLKASV